MPTKCETVNVRVVAEDKQATQVTMPAFTVSEGTFRGRVEKLTEKYIQRSKVTHNGMSLGDFSLFLVSEASQDPRYVK